jgi:hypothetical protein
MMMMKASKLSDIYTIRFNLRENLCSSLTEANEKHTCI